MPGHALIRDNATGVVHTSDGIVIPVMPDPTGETDGFVLTIDTGVAVWLPISAVSSLNGITGGVNLVAGANVAITPNTPTFQDITIEASGSVGDGWEDDSAETWTRLADFQFTVDGLLDTKYSPGTRIKLAYSDDLFTFHFYVVTVSSNDGAITTVTLAGDYDDPLRSDIGITIVEQHHSYVSVPDLYPGWFRGTVSDIHGITGWDGPAALFHVIGRTCFYIPNVGGTSNGTEFDFLVTSASGSPIPNEEVEAIGQVTDGGVVKLGMAESQTPAAGEVKWVVSTLLAGPPDYSIQPDAVGWTNVGRKDTGALVMQFAI